MEWNVIGPFPKLKWLTEGQYSSLASVEFSMQMRVYSITLLGCILTASFGCCSVCFYSEFYLLFRLEM